MIIGMPNLGLEVEVDLKPFSGLIKKELKNNIATISEVDYHLEEKDLKYVILYLICHYLFSCSCNKIPELYISLSDPTEFVKYNWQKTIHFYLMASVCGLAMKRKKLKG
ncbi:hypothetical protein KSP39_PZI005533 [Platanthera zijinensis]|uniref:Uncharacterized protein n=1 Tax=Platanthera zijinensis TaxID=2320716 RepID=A0AAP0GAI7_9ASPA